MMSANGLSALRRRKNVDHDDVAMHAERVQGNHGGKEQDANVDDTDQRHPHRRFESLAISNYCLRSP